MNSFHPMRRTRRIAGLLAALLVATNSGCVTLDRNVERTPSHALSEENAGSTELGRRWTETAPADPALSAFRLLPNSIEAFAARVALIDLAERTLDLQYYIFETDETGLYIVDRLVAAADRGVRVRMLIDDMYAHGVESGLVAFDSHPNIELRLFNPWTQRGGKLDSGLEFLVTPRLNHRMHNKLLIGDGTIGIFGGRNIADEYFDLHEEFEFKDLDVAVAGPVAAEGGALFDAFWNGPDAVPLTGIEPPPDSEANLRDARARLAAHRERMRDSVYAHAVRESDFAQALGSRTDRWVFAKGRLLADSPDKTTRSDDPLWKGSLGESVGAVFFSAQREVIASSPYFVPRSKGCERLAELAGRGVAVTILTNSFAANDVGLVHAGYSKYRARLLRDGVKLFELRRRAAGNAQADASEGGAQSDDGRAFGSANASLHAKTFVVDRERVFIGSMNLDPRSIALNTEIGVLIESPELAESVAQSILQLTSPQWSYRLAIGPVDELIWIGQDAKGNEVIFRRDPDTSAWQRFTNGVLGLLPIEGQI